MKRKHLFQLLIAAFFALAAAGFCSCQGNSPADSGSPRRAQGLALLQRGKESYFQGEWKEAGILLDDAAGRLPDNRTIALWQIRNQLAGGEADRAETALSLLLREDPQDPRLLYLYSRCAAAARNLPLTTARLEEAAAAAEGWHMIFLDLARLSRQMGFSSQACRYLRRTEALLGPANPLMAEVERLQEEWNPNPEGDLP